VRERMAGTVVGVAWVVEELEVAGTAEVARMAVEEAGFDSKW